MLTSLFRKIPFKKIVLWLVIVASVFFIGRIYESERGPALHRWHTWTGNEMSAREIDQASFAEYQAQEETIFRELKLKVTDTLNSDEKTALNRFYAESAVYPDKLPRNWNRSFILMPEGKPRGTAVMLHGLTDSPYSMRALALDYQQQGFIVVAPRIPGHGTAPGSLTTVNWEEWMATTRLAVREAVRLAGPDIPLHMVGYSNGGALAMKYALESLNNSSLRQPQQIVLLSPMIGVTSFARFAGLAGLPAVFPPFAKAAWFGVSPEYNPFKYNSFPIRAASESWQLTQALQQQLTQAARNNELNQLPPVLTFQSVMDSTVRTRAVVDSLYHFLPDNGSELVIFDINHATSLGALFRPASWSAISTLLPVATRNYRTTVITNAAQDSSDAVARITMPGQQEEVVQPLHIAWPQDMYSQSHVSVPFPLSDSLYGSEPAEKERYGISIGTLSERGESATLRVSQDALMRVTSNPFFPYMLERINHRINCDTQVCLTEK